ncbi:MAG: cytochrome c-type biogenesis CcmF C-terminal domain-containing protein, partial [Gammaproteobacteria bacterium]
LGLGKISVGPPYFATVFIIPTIPMVLLMSLGMHTAWKKADWSRVTGKVRLAFFAALVLGIAVPLFVYGRIGLLLAIGVFASFWLMMSSLLDPATFLWKRRSLRGYPRSLLGMHIAHFGIGVFVLGVAITSAFGVEKDVGMKRGEVLELSGSTFQLNDLSDVQGPNYTAVQAEVVVRKGDTVVATLNPQKRVYRVQTNPMTEASIHPRLSRDLFVALGEPLGADTWSMRVQYKPMIRLIWLGALLMAFGGLVSVSDQRYRARRRSEAPSGAVEAAST